MQKEHVEAILNGRLCDQSEILIERLKLPGSAQQPGPGRAVIRSIPNRAMLVEIRDAAGALIASRAAPFVCYWELTNGTVVAVWREPLGDNAVSGDAEAPSNTHVLLALFGQKDEKAEKPDVLVVTDPTGLSAIWLYDSTVRVSDPDGARIWAKVAAAVGLPVTASAKS